jgi:isopentenyl diphosphate isomerase/L-lactate dehydrogenase-like FMN-dependent dehydrogenase
MTAFRYRLSESRAPISIEDYRALARRALPDMVWAYVDYGADDMQTMRANRAAFGRWNLRTRVLAGHPAPQIEATVAGSAVSLPVLLAPTGLVGLSHWSGERGAAQAAEQAGTLSIMSAGSSYSLEEIAAATRRDHFFQLYLWTDRRLGRHDLTVGLLERARAAGFRALVVTVDVPTRGNRESERRRGMGNPPVLTPRRILNAAWHPRWCAALVRHQRISMRTFVDEGGARAAVRSMTEHERALCSDLTWDDLATVRRLWEGPLFVKGILDADDAERAIDLGATGLVVSNHGGRQLDGAPATLDALPAVAERVGGRAEILLDGGIRRGTDIVKALCLGATAVCIGRPYLYGLAAGGPAGARHVIEILREELCRCLTLMGVGRLSELSRSSLIPADTTVT